MSVDAGTQTRYDIVGEREDFEDSIYDLTPAETPFLSGCGRGEASGIFHEWQVDELNAVDDDNVVPDGDEAAFEVPPATTRVGNVCQISRKTAKVAGTTEKVKKAGRGSQMAYEMVKRSKELKRDEEAMLLKNQAADLGSRGAPRRLAGLLAWIKTNVNMGTGAAANPTWTDGAPDDTRTDGTQRAFDETQLTDVIQQGYTNGANFDTLMVGPYNKSVFSTFDGIAAKTVQVPNTSAKAVTVGAVDIYVSNFGDIRCIPNRIQRERDAFLIDWEQVSVLSLRPYEQTQLAKTGDSDARMILHEYTLKVNNELGLGLIADLTVSA